MSTKSRQLQIRVTPYQKAALKRLARGADQDVSGYVLARALPEARLRFGEIIRVLRDGEDHRFALAELNDLLSGLTRAQLPDAVAVAPPEMRDLSSFLQNYVAAMVEQASYRRKVPVPSWGRGVPPLEAPYFATPLQSLRLHLLRAAPVPFKRRNIFVDSGVGARVWHLRGRVQADEGRHSPALRTTGCRTCGSRRPRRGLSGWRSSHVSRARRPRCDARR